MPRRGVKKDTFAGLVFTLTSGTDSTLGQLISDNGGSVVQSVTKKTTHVVTTPKEFGSAKPPAKVAKAQKERPDVVIVSEAFILASVKEEKVLDPKDFPMDAPAADEDDKDSPMDTSTDDKGKNKRKAADSPEDDKDKATAGKRARTTKKSESGDGVDDVSKGDAEVAASKTTKKGKGAKKSKVQDDGDENDEEDKPVEEVKILKQIKKGKVPVDSEFPNAQAFSVFEKDGVVYGAWGRVGERGQSKRMDMSSVESAISDFQKKFREKTQNHWDDRHNFVKKPGKYFLIERSWEEDEEEEKGEKPDLPPEDVKIPDSTLATPVQDLMKMIFDLSMMEKEMKEIGYDAKKLPLGKLTKTHIQKGYNELKALADELSKPNPDKEQLHEHTNLFFTIIPHDFGRNRPPLLDTMEKVQAKIKMVEALADIEVTTTLLGGIKDRDTTVNPIDQKYESLKCHMKVVEKDSETFKLVETYTANTHGHTHTGYKLKVEEVFE
ncbi:Poly [ADP-ribose] polymerase 2, partial [Phlyctochytrium bullatum]